MTKPVFKTLSLSVMAFVLATTPAPAEPDQVACSTRHAIDLGWEYQQGLLEGRLDARAAASIEVKGAIISPPFPTYAPYRQDVLRGSVDQSSDSRLSQRQPPARPEPSVDRF